MEAYIKGISYYLPNSIVTNRDLNELYPEWSIDKIGAKTGIFSRHIADKDEYASDMGVKAANLLIEEYKIDRSKIDFLLFCTQSPDYFLPTTACIIQERLGLPNSCGALDYNLGCSGYIYGLALAKGLIVSGIAKNILFITSETYSKFINPNDKSNKSIFGDGASATLVSFEGLCSIGEFRLGTDGSGANNLIVKKGGLRFPLNTSSTNPEDEFLYMNGPEIFTFTSNSVPDLIIQTIEKNAVTKENIDLFIFHQANEFMLKHLRKISQIPEDKFFVYLKDCANTVSSTIPIALKEAINLDKIKPGSKCLLAGFGVGYSWGGTILFF